MPALNPEFAEVAQRDASARLAEGGEWYLIRLQQPKHVVTRCTAAPLECKPLSA